MLQEIKWNDSIYRERDAEIREIENDVQTVHDIFSDVAILVQNQGEYVDNIESNVDASARSVLNGVNELEKAETYQKSARSKSCIIIMILFFVICFMVILLILGLGLALKF